MISPFLRGCYDAAHAGLDRVVAERKSRFGADLDKEAGLGVHFSDHLINHLEAGNLDGAKAALAELSGKPGMDALVAAALIELYPEHADAAFPARRDSATRLHEEFLAAQAFGGETAVGPPPPGMEYLTSAPIPTPIPPSDSPTAPYPTVFSVQLKKVGKSKIDVIRVIRDSTHLSLAETKDMIAEAPTQVMGGMTIGEAEALREKLSAAGATVEVK